MPKKSEVVPVKAPKVAKSVNSEAKVVAPKVTKVVKKTSLKAEVYNLKGEVSGNFELPEEVFGQKVNKALLSQAIRVYQSHQMGHHGHTKTRGEVSISTRKIYKQKGTGGARHGAKSAPIFVGGGIAMGPRLRKIELELPKKMQKAALVSALSSMVIDQKLAIIDGLDAASGKTKEMASFVSKIGLKKACLVGIDPKSTAARASANLGQIQFETADKLNLLRVLQSDKLILTREAVTKIVTRIKGDSK